MQMKQIIDDPIGAWVNAESFINDGSPSGFGHHGTVAQEFWPENGKVFRLPVVGMDPSDKICRSGLPAPECLALAHHSATNYAYLCMHPQFYTQLSAHKSIIGATPGFVEARATSSIRTVWVIENGVPQSFVKLHFPDIIGRFSRRIPLYSWLASLENSRMIAGALSDAPEGFAFLPETGGAFLESDGRVGGFGHIERSLRPLPETPDRRILLPYFSLWAKDSRLPEDPPIIESLIFEFALDFSACMRLFVEPLLAGYRHLAFSVGLLPECNAQNVIWEFDTKKRNARVVHRDLMGLFKDLDFGLASYSQEYPLNAYHTIGLRVVTDTQLRRSFSFDFKLGQYVLEPLMNQFSRIFRLPIDQVRGAMKACSTAILQWPNEYFPGDGMAYGYPKQTDVGRDSYISLGDPIYR